MGARIYTPDEERRYKLPPLPETPFIGIPASQALNRAYEAQRASYAAENPPLTREQIQARL